MPPQQQQHQSLQQQTHQTHQEQPNLQAQQQQQFPNFNQPTQPVQQQQQFYQPAPGQAANALNPAVSSQGQLNQYANPALKQQIPPPNPQQPQQQFGQQPNLNDPQMQAYYQQQQQLQQQQQGPLPTGYQPPAAHQHPGVANPYSKGPNQSLARPPSATMYQQGYK